MTDDTPRLAQTQSQPVAWRYQMKEGWDGIWRVVTVFPTFESPLNWRVEPLYAALAPGNAAQGKGQRSAFEKAWASRPWHDESSGKDIAFYWWSAALAPGNGAVEHFTDLEISNEWERRFGVVVDSANSIPSPAALDPVTVEAQKNEAFLFEAADIAYFKAGRTSHPQDWLEAGLLARQHRNALSKVRALIGQPANNGEPVAKSLEFIQKSADEVVSRVCEWDDRTSPDDFPEALLITPSELHRELVRFADDIGALASPSNPQDTVTSTDSASGSAT